MDEWRYVCLNIDGWMEICMFEYRWVGGGIYVWIKMDGWMERCMFGYRLMGGWR